MEELDLFIANKKNNFVKSMSFIDYVYYLMNQKNLTSSDVYNRGDIDRRVWSGIISNKMKPSLKMAVKIAIGLKCNNDECKLLLKKLSYTLSRSSDFALVIRFCIKNEIYNLVKINELLYEKGLEML